MRCNMYNLVLNFILNPFVLSMNGDKPRTPTAQ